MNSVSNQRALCTYARHSTIPFQRLNAIAVRVIYSLIFEQTDLTEPNYKQIEGEVGFFQSFGVVGIWNFFDTSVNT